MNKINETLDNEKKKNGIELTNCRLNGRKESQQ